MGKPDTLALGPGCAILDGDCREMLSVFPDRSVSLICIDPPYNTSDTMQSGRAGSVKVSETKFHNISFSDDVWASLIKRGFEILEKGGRQLIFCNQMLQMQVENVVMSQKRKWGMRKLTWNHKSGGPLSRDSVLSSGYTEMQVAEYVICVHRVGDFKNSTYAVGVAHFPVSCDRDSLFASGNHRVQNQIFLVNSMGERSSRRLSTSTSWGVTRRQLHATSSSITA